jgi:Flp pilus assembly protein TadD
VRAALKEYGEAVKHLQKAVTLEPGDKAIREALTQVGFAIHFASRIAKRWAI